MSLKQIQKLMEKLEDALQDVEIDLDSVVEERKIMNSGLRKRRKSLNSWKRSCVSFVN